MPRDSRLPSLSQDNHSPLEPRVETSPLDISSRRSRTPHHEERSRSGDGQSAEEADRRAGTWVGTKQEDMWRGLPRPAGESDHPPSMAPLRFSGSGLPVSSPAQYELAMPLALTSRMPPVPDVPRDSLGRRAGKRPAPSSTQSTPHGLPPPPDFSERASSAPGGDRDNTDDDGDEAADVPPGKKARLFLCHVCNRPAETEEEFKSHTRQHYDYSCTMCNYTTNSKRRFEYHMKCHGTEDEKPQPKAARQRNPICQKCDLIFNSKEEFWDHRREIHISSDKLLACTECKFVTEYKHHLEYHVSNHMNFKPYRCGKCNYSCVNKSSLKSHMKSHSSVHQFWCRDCSYSTKFSHSLKQHCQKYNHTPAVPLNPDGSVPDGVDIVEAGLTTLQKPRAPRGPRRGAKGSRNGDDFSQHFPQETLMPGFMGPTMVPLQYSVPNGPSVSPLAPSLMLPGHQHQGLLPNRSPATTTVTSQTLGTMQDNDGHQYPHCGFGEISRDDLEKHIDQAHKGVSEPPPSDRSKMATAGGSDGKGDSMLKQPASVVNLPPSFLPQQPGQPQSRDPRIPTDSENPQISPIWELGDDTIDAHDLEELPKLFAPNGPFDWHTDTQTNGQTGKRTDRQTDRQGHRQTDRQGTDTRTDREQTHG